MFELLDEDDRLGSLISVVHRLIVFSNRLIAGQEIPRSDDSSANGHSQCTGFLVLLVERLALAEKLCR